MEKSSFENLSVRSTRNYLCYSVWGHGMKSTNLRGKTRGKLQGKERERKMIFIPYIPTYKKKKKETRSIRFYIRLPLYIYSTDIGKNTYLLLLTLADNSVTQKIYRRII